MQNKLHNLQIQSNVNYKASLNSSGVLQWMIEGMSVRTVANNKNSQTFPFNFQMAFK